MDTRRLIASTVATVLLGCSLAIPVGASASGLDDRDSAPVVLTGADTPLLVGSQPDAVVAFRYLGGWQQVPVQVDERKMIDYRPVRQFQGDSREFRAMAYADPDTWAEADGVPQTMTANPKGSGAVIPGTTGDPLLDDDDEIAMMAADAGASAAGEAAPAGVDPATRTPVKVTDPLDPGNSHFIYLFRTTTGLDPSAGVDLVRYDQSYSPALAGDYRTTYNYNALGDDVNGPPVNPEDSEVKTDRYEIGIPGRWLVDRLQIAAGDGTDILDGDKSTVGTTGCGRNELTFSRGGGGFIANIDGPVRAIRSFIGANSGTFTQREYVFYEGMWENRTTLRVHAGISAFVTAMDLSAGAVGMTYRNELNPGGVLIDGVQDSPVQGQFDWEQFSGDQGSVTNVARLTTDMPDVNIGSYYQDMATPPANSSMLCSGDTHSYGAAGAFITTPYNNSDPTLADAYPDLPVSHFSSVRYTWFDGPGANAATGELRSRQIDSPLAVATGAAVDPDPGPGPGPDPDPAAKPRLSVKVKPTPTKIRRGGKRQVRVTVRNFGDAAAQSVRVCLRRAKALKPVRCQTIAQVKPGKAVTRKFRLKVRRRAGTGLRKFRFRVTGPGVKAVGAKVRVRIVRH